MTIRDAHQAVEKGVHPEGTIRPPIAQHRLSQEFANVNGQRARVLDAPELLMGHVEGLTNAPQHGNRRRPSRLETPGPEIPVPVSDEIVGLTGHPERAVGSHRQVIDPVGRERIDITVPEHIEGQPVKTGEPAIGAEP